jgi:hypothetical protein
LFGSTILYFYRISNFTKALKYLIHSDVNIECLSSVSGGGYLTTAYMTWLKKTNGDAKAALGAFDQKNTLLWQMKNNSSYVTGRSFFSGFFTFLVGFLETFLFIFLFGILLGQLYSEVSGELLLEALSTKHFSDGMRLLGDTLAYYFGIPLGCWYLSHIVLLYGAHIVRMFCHCMY